ncbi:MCE family protein [Mycobacterium sp. SMC-8]|uniref:MCE family protein n=1 Tax=Mycobacterium sp. SMC-8 TaxID=2857060 RepID=UPI0021B37DF9|nr:MCE family protein [Mycobacterium sp. SMC-8]UXA11567.1 MCE family protein [Mycobacterium sp. SMC-8]
MNKSKALTRSRIAVALLVILVVGIVLVTRHTETSARVHVTGFFANSNGIYPGDEVRILGVPVGKIESIEPQGNRAKIDFWYDSRFKVPAEAKAAILSPSLVSVRAIQLTPRYSGGPTLQDDATIPEDRTAVPVEWDDFREQLEKLTESLQPTSPGGVSSLGGFINTAADNLRGEGANIRETLIQLSQAFSALGDHSTDIFSTVKNISILVSALQNSADIMRKLNQNLSGVTNALANDDNEVGSALTDVSGVVGDVSTFLADNRDAVGTASESLASITTALYESLGDLKQTLHVAPTAFQNFVNIYQPAQGALTGVLAINNFSNPIDFICGAIQAASRLGAEESAKLCVQYLAPIVKNRQYNFPPLGENLFVGAAARPNEVTYSEDWMRPDYIPPPAAEAPGPDATPAGTDPFAAESTDPAAGLPGLMVPAGSGS